MAECIKPNILLIETKGDRPVIVKLLSGKTYEGTVKSRDCLGVLFTPKYKQIPERYIFYNQIEQVIFK